MKSIEPAAMEAIEAGEAIVTGAVEIIPAANITYTLVGALNVAATAFAGSLAARTTTYSGFSTSDYFVVSKPSVAAEPSLIWDAWSAWSADNSVLPLPPPVVGQTWDNRFTVYGNNGGSDTLLFTPAIDSNLYATESGAFAALASVMPQAFTGYTTYKIVVVDDPNPPDNRNGLSLLVRKGEAEAVSGSPIRVWGGYGPIEIDGEEYLGVGDRAIAQQTSGAIGGVAQGITLSLSGVEADLVGLIDADEIKGASVVLRRLIFASDGKTLLDAHVFDRGRVDTIETPETVGGTATIQIMVESAARGLGRSLARQRADSDQRLIAANDGYFKNTAYAGEKMLYWGGRRPSRTGDGI